MRFQTIIKDPSAYLERIKEAARRGELINALGMCDSLENYLNENETERTKVLIEQLRAIVDAVQLKVDQVIKHVTS